MPDRHPTKTPRDFADVAFDAIVFGAALFDRLRNWKIRPRQAPARRPDEAEIIDVEFEEVER